MNPVTDPRYDEMFQRLIAADGELRRLREREPRRGLGRRTTRSRGASPSGSRAFTSRTLLDVSHLERTGARALTEVTRDLGLEEAKEQITARGRERGFVTSEDLLESVPVDDFTPEQVEEFLTQVEEHLRGEGIEVIEVPGDEVDASAQRQLDVDLLKAPTNDPVRMYLKEIGKVPLLTAAAGGRPRPADRGGGVRDRAPRARPRRRTGSTRSACAR